MNGSDYAATVAGWFDTLREGNAIPWTDFLAGGAGGRPARPPLSVGAAHLQLVRLLAQRLGPGRSLEQLADLVVATPAFGRGRVEIPLAMPGTPDTAGPPPMDPAAVPAGELLRIAVPVLARLQTPVRPDPPPTRSLRLPTRRTRFVLHGNPGLVRPIRSRLLRSGLREGGRRASHIVLVAPIGPAVLGIWGARIAAGGAIGWRRLWSRLANAPVPAAGVDPTVLLDGLGDQVRHDRVHVVLGGGVDTLAARVGAVLGCRVEPLRQPSWGELDLARRLNLFTAARLDRAERGNRARALLDEFAAFEHRTQSGAAVPQTHVIPRAQRPWARATARQVRDRLAAQVRAGGYAVHGDLEGELEEVGRMRGQSGAIGPESTLAAAIEALSMPRGH